MEKHKGHFTRCKVRCEFADGGRIILRPVISGDPESENGKFYRATPGGVIDLQVVRPGVVAGFDVGREYYVDFHALPAPADQIT